MQPTEIIGLIVDILVAAVLYAIGGLPLLIVGFILWVAYTFIRAAKNNPIR